MRYTQAFIPTLKEDPADAEAVSHKLMVRAGLIRKLISGAYSYLPLGMRVLNKVIDIVREEMNNAGALEILMPALQPAELWHETGRYDVLGEELIKFKDRHGKEMVIGPTHEEVVTDIARGHVRSYKDLPMILYQIQTKLRDEPRPRFGVIRSKEFIMKDAYSFDATEQGLDINYKKMFAAYNRIFERCGLETITVEADVGVMGGSESAEFMVMTESGEDIVTACGACGYKSSLAMISCVAEAKKGRKEPPKCQEVSTPGVSTVDKVSKLLKCNVEQMIKTLIYVVDDKPVAVLVRGDHEVNETKLAKVLNARTINLADEKTIQKVTGGPLGFSGPCRLKGLVIVIDHAVCCVEDGVTGANQADAHLIHVFPGRDFIIQQTHDIRYIGDNEPCPKCKKGTIVLKRAMEVGHIFKLGTKYSDSMKARFLDSDGKEKAIIMGCYGIGVNRIIAACIEQANDKDGIKWPISIAPYEVVILALNTDDEKVMQASEDLYKRLQKDGIEVLFDDRKISPGMKFKDADLLGIPLQVIIGPKKIPKDIAELKIRSTGKKLDIPLSKLPKELQKHINRLGF